MAAGGFAGYGVGGAVTSSEKGAESEHARAYTFRGRTGGFYRIFSRVFTVQSNSPDDCQLAWQVPGIVWGDEAKPPVSTLADGFAMCVSKEKSSG